MRLADVHRALTAPSDEAKPQMRWWWFGPDISAVDVDRQLAAMQAAGIGGVEVAFVYPLRPGSPDWLSDEVLAVLRHAAERAREIGLRFHVTLGSGWSFGGTHVTPDNAARQLVWERRAVPPGSRILRPVHPESDEHLVAAAIYDGDLADPVRGAAALVIAADQSVAVPDGRGPRVVLLGVTRPTGQVVKRAAAGADGPVLDHYSAAATRQHVEHVGGRILGAVPAGLIESFFCDSLEVYAANWTDALPEEFERRRGYSFDGLLHHLAESGGDPTRGGAELAAAAVAAAGSPGDAGDGDDDTAVAHRLRADFVRTLSELYEENFVAVCRGWCSDHGVPFRIQGYGEPPARVGSYRFADRYEGEGWGWKTLTATRWASSAAHVDGVNTVSCEAWTWTHSPSFRATPLDLRGEAHEHFLSGVNELLGHGWPHSPGSATDDGAGASDAGLGWFFYAAGALDDRNPWWPAMPALMGSLQRLGDVLREGRPQRDVLLLVSNDETAQTLQRAADGSQHLDLYKATRAALPDGLVAALREAGRDFDLVDDTMLDRVTPSTGQVVVVAGSATLSSAERTWLSLVSAEGGHVFAVESPGAPGTSVAVDGLVAAVDAVLPRRSGAAVAPDAPGALDLGVVRRDGDTTDVAVLINTGPHTVPFTWESRTARSRTEFWSPDTGAQVPAGAPGVLAPYEAVVVVETDEPEGVTDPAPASRLVEVALEGPWTVAFDDASPSPVTLPHRWEDTRPSYSGSAVYETSVVLADDQVAGAASLSLGPSAAWAPERRTEAETLRSQSYRAHVDPPVGEVAVMHVNGVLAGVAWAPPYAVPVSGLLRAGSNEVRIEVFNTLANRLAGDPAPAALEAAVESSYGRRFHFQDLERAAVDLRSGLFGPVTLRLG
ncbi:glycosyl hydrolase [Frondihabitans australicus]|uniref:Alpha-L-rhamnosidase-like protein n=1 Tax=Frondihabitans australicus TaxID=386892 RepID=A0A495IFK1_9MICO|nr:glycosyl hydrolase [Frondihabitans australicus]RKR74430.1 alpha-L-rhamnosidase-like protein [Frondihabitans australicus]